MLFWYAFRPQLPKFALGCLGTFGATSLFAFTTGALMFRLGWFGLGIAGVLGMLVAHRLSEGERGHGLGMGMANLRQQIRAMEQQRQHKADPRAAAPSHDAATKENSLEARRRADRLELVSLGSLAMTAIGFIMFFRYQV